MRRWPSSARPAVNEDSGQAELLASTAIGRVSRLAAAVAAALIWSLVVGAVAAVLTGLCGGGWSTSLLLGATFTASGWMFAGIAAVTAQLGSDARTASALAVGVLGVLFVLRGVTYTLGTPGWTVWANHLGWMTETRPASGDHWWPLLPALVLTLGCLAVASAIQTRRDVGHGVLATRPGPARGSVRSSWRLALRLHRGAAATWAVAFVALGAVFGFFAASVHDILGADSAVTAILAAGAATPDALVSRFVVTILGLVGIIAAVPGVQLLLRVRAEELQGRVEPVLAGAVSRRRFYAAHVTLGLVLCAAYVLLAGLLIAAVADAAGIGVSFWAVWGQAAVTVPAVWAVVAVAIAVVGARPRLAAAAWVGVVVSFALTLLGPTFRLPDPYLALSPFWHVPAVPGGDGAVGGLSGVCLVAAVLTTVGFVGFGRRDLGTV